MKSNQVTPDEYRRMKAETAARELGISPLPEALRGPATENGSFSPAQTKLSPQADAAIDFINHQKKIVDDAYAVLRRNNVSPQFADEIIRKFSNDTQALQGAINELSSDKPGIREHGRETLGMPSDPEDKKKVEANEENTRHLMNIVAAGAVIGIASHDTAAAPVSAVSATAVPAGAITEIKEALPQVSDQVLDATQGDAAALGLTLFGRSGDLNQMTVENSLATPAPSAGTSKKSVAEEVLGSPSPTAIPIAPS